MIKKSFLAVSLLGASFCANATIISGYGAYADGWTGSNCPSYCTTAGGGQFVTDMNGAEFASSAAASVDSYALTQSSSQLTGSTYLPILKVKTSAGVGVAGSAMAFGVQGFTYSGSGATTITLDINLHGSVGIDTLGPYNHNSLSASVAVMIGSELDWYPSFATLVSEVATGDFVGSEGLSIGSGTDVNTGTSITFDLDPGTDFYVIAAVNAFSNNGYADGWNTLTMQFDDDSGLTAASMRSVPEPSAFWLFGAGLVGFLGVHRRGSVTKDC